MSDSSKILKFGDFIVFKGTLQKIDMLKSGAVTTETEGYISALGHTDSHLFFQHIPKVIMEDIKKSDF
jgi:hypothetical protein